MTVGNKIKNFRKSEGMTQQHLADILCVSRQAISNWEQGKSEPDIQMLQRISKALHKRTESFFDRDEEAQKYSNFLNFFDELIGSSEINSDATSKRTSSKGYEGSIVYNGTEVRLIPEQMSGSGNERIMEFDGLQIRLTYRKVGRGVYVLPKIKNISPKNSGQISKPCSLDIILPQKQVTFSTIKGDNANQDNFMPVVMPLSVGDQLHREPTGGRSSDNEGFPFFTLNYGCESVLVGIGWTGQWNYDLSVTEMGTRVTVSVPDADFYLRPDEEVRLPSILLLSDGSEDKVLRRLKQFIKDEVEHFHPNGKSLPIALQTFDRYCWTGSKQYDETVATEQGQKRIIDAMVACDGFETCWLDACWFKDSVKFPEGVGNYSCSECFPNGLAPVSDYAHEKGFNFLVWFEVERIYKDSEVWREYPDYIVAYDDGLTHMLDLSRPEVVDFALKSIIKTMKDNKIDIYRQDCNMYPIIFWPRRDEPGRRGITHLHYVQGLYDLWDGLRAAFPGLMIDNCATGGRRIDLESAMRTVILWRSDAEGHDEATTGKPTTIWKQNTMLTLNRYIPYHGTGTWVADAYDFRGSATSGIACGFDVLAPDFDYKLAHEALSELARVRKYWHGDFYPMTAPTTDMSVWCIYRFGLNGDGIVYCFRRPESINDSMLICIEDATAENYKVLFSDEQRCITELELTGEQLRSGITVNIPSPRASLLVEYIAK